MIKEGKSILDLEGFPNEYGNLEAVDCGAVLDGRHSGRKSARNTERPGSHQRTGVLVKELLQRRHAIGMSGLQLGNRIIVFRFCTLGSIGHQIEVTPKLCNRCIKPSFAIQFYAPIEMGCWELILFAFLGEQGR